MLILPITRKWFDMIGAGIKKEEYRSLTPYYRSRFERYLGTDIECILRNGYSDSSPSLRIIARVEKGTGREEWGAAPGVTYYKLRILEYESVRPETFIIKARRCKRCGGILTSSKAVKDGYGHVCRLKEERERKNAELMKNQMSLFE